MTGADGTPDPGDPTATDEEAYEAELAEDDPVAPEAQAVADGVADVEAAEIEGSTVDDSKGGGFQ